MNETGQPQNRVRTGIRALAEWIRSQRSDYPVQTVETVRDPETDSIEFTSLSLISGTPELLNSFSLLSDRWIRRHCDAFVYGRAVALVDSANVVLISASEAQLRGTVCDGELFAVMISLEEVGAGVGSSCTCETYRRYKDLGTSTHEWLPCEHITALAHHIVVNQLIALVSTAQLTAVCPITRIPLVSSGVIYRCENCRLAFSREGWQFLKEMDRGRCCGCHNRNCIRPQAADTEG